MSDIQQHLVKNSDGTISIGTTQDVQDLLDQNTVERNIGYNNVKLGSFGQKVASIPLNIINAWCKEWNCTMGQLMSDPLIKVKLFARLRDPAYSKLRTYRGGI